MCNTFNSVAFCIIHFHNGQMVLNSLSKRNLQDLYQKIQHEFKQGRLVSELEDIDFQIKAFTKKEGVTVKDFRSFEKMLNELKEDKVLIWRLPQDGHFTEYLDIIEEDEEIFTDYVVNIYDYEKLESVFQRAGIINDDVDDGRVLIFLNGEFYIGKDRTPLSFVNKTKTKYYKVLKAIFELSKTKPKGMTEKQIIKQIFGTKRNSLTKGKIINAINDSIKPALGEQYEFFEWLNNGKLIFHNPLLKDFERPKNGKK